MSTARDIAGVVATLPIATMLAAALVVVAALRRWDRMWGGL